MKCSYCFKDVAPGRFCENCGAPLNTEADSPVISENPSRPAATQLQKPIQPVETKAPVPQTASVIQNQLNKEPLPVKESAGRSALTTKKAGSMRTGLFLYILILVLTISLGSLLGFWAGKENFSLFSSGDDGSSGDFHWNDPQKAVHRIITPDDASQSNN